MWAKILKPGGIWENDAFLGHEMRGPAGIWRGGVSMAGGREGQSARKENGVRGHHLPFHKFCSEFAYVFRLSVSMRKVASEYPFCVLIYMNSYVFDIYFIHLFYCHISYFILYAWRYHWPTYMELPNTHAHTYRDVQTHTHTQKQKTQKKEDVTKISKPQWLTLVRIKDCTLRAPNKTTTLFLYEYW